VIVITGASGGIGAALARYFSGEGAQLALTDIDDSALRELAKELRDSGTKVITQSLDVRDESTMQNWVREIDSTFGKIDHLINNAGMTNFTLFEEQEFQAIERLMDINVRGVMLGCHLFLPLLKRSDCGHIVNLSSMIAYAAAPMQSTYTASKWAIRGFSRALRMELREHSIGVTAVMPGTIATPLLYRAQSADPDGAARMSTLMLRFGSSPQKVAKRIARAIRSNKGELRVGWDSHMVALLQWLTPGLLPTIIQFAYRRYVRKLNQSKSKSSIEKVES